MGVLPFNTDWRQLAVVGPDIAQDGLRQVLAAVEMMALLDPLDPAVEALDLGMNRASRRGSV